MTSHGSVIVHARSDAVSNPAGTRIGTAEIYQNLDRIPEVIGALVIEQQWQGNERAVLLVGHHAKEVSFPSLVAHTISGD